MSDDFDRLTAALRSTPSPDPDAKARALALAQENFARAQASTDPARPIGVQSAQTGLWERITTMFATSVRPALYITTSIVVVGLGVVITQPHWTGPPVLPSVTQATAPASQEVASAPVPTASADVAVREEPALVPSPLESAAIAAPSAKRAAPSLQMGGLAGGEMIFAETDSMVVGRVADDVAILPPATDRFANATANGVKIAAEDPVSTFSIDVDTASYSVVRRWLQQGALPPVAAVRVEEMVNYFPYDYATPTGDAPFSTQVTLTQTPWNPDTRILHIGLQGAVPTERPPLDLVFLVDTSGSMQNPDKLPLLIQSLKLMLGELAPTDTIAIVTYAGSAGTALERTAASERGKIINALDSLTAGGGTAGAAGLDAAYALAETAEDDGRVGRVILATDGDFNVGLSSDTDMQTFIEEKRESGTYLSVLGFGRGNLNDGLMQTLAQAGNGQAAYIDTLSEARKVLVDQLQAALVPIADDVKVQVEFNPAVVAEYRLIGYETRALARTDFNNDAVDAGEVGAGHRVTALYEVTPVGSSAQLSDPLRYGTVAEGAGEELAFVKLRYKAPGADSSQLLTQPVANTVAQPSTEVQFATAIAGFGQLLRGNTALDGWTYGDAITLATGARGADTFGYRAEALQLMRLAQSITGSE